MRILVTGATGFIGKHLALRLALEGHERVVLARNPSAAREALIVPCEVHAWDAMQGRPPRAALSRIDAVIHLAGEPLDAKRWNSDQKRKIHDSRVEGTRNLLEGIRESGFSFPSVVVSMSAIGIYGDRGAEALAEDSEPGADYLARVCRDWESALFANVPTGTRAVAIRTGLVLGKDGGMMGQVLPVFRMGAGGILGNGKQWMSWIHIEDLVSVFMEALRNPALSGPVNATAPEPVTNKKFTRTLARILHKPAVARVPRLALRALKGEMAGAILSSQKVFPEKLRTLDFQFRFPGLEAALGDVCVPAAPGMPEFDQEWTSYQWVPRPASEVWRFFADSRNLAVLTDPAARMRIESQSTAEMGLGTTLDLTVRVAGLPVRWRSRIEEWVPESRFVDVQLQGPFARWWHEHTFQPLQGGTLVRDRVIYRVPGSHLGSAVGGWKVRKQLERIFGYRRRKLQELFPGPTSQNR